MVAGAACDDVDAIDGRELFEIERELVELQMAVHHAPRKGVADGARLLEDLLHHEVGVPAALGGRDIPVDMHDLGFDRLAVEVAIGD